MADQPLISCVMPTYDRRPFVSRAIQYFQRQDYPHKELIILDDGTDPVADLVPADPAIRYLRLEKRQTVGAKRNLGCREARGEVILNWDDDDWYAAHRVSYQVGALLQSVADVCGTSGLLFLDVQSGHAWKYTYPDHRKQWLAGSTLCYRRSFWARNPFPNVDVGEDAYFVWSEQPKQLIALPDESFVVALIHPRNVSPKRVQGPCWRAHPTEEVQRLVGPDWPLFEMAAGTEVAAQAQPPAAAGLAADAPAAAAVPAPEPPAPEQQTPVSDLAVARAAHLQLTEFRAYNHGQSLPRMRQWELPFALARARLGGTMAVLDYTINPCGFEQRLQALYPHISYRHVSPMQQNQFALPAGLPDGAFDRVFCINTLEHLLRPQREALVRDMARKLKPGGLLILTCDHYFDWFWERPQILSSGVMRADRAEVPGGWNRVTPAEWAEICRPHGLEPVLMPAAEPRDDDPALYRNVEPYPHATIGGVFQKAGGPPPGAGRQVVLSLLTWNTRQVSLESLQAYVREAHMLQRMGHQPVLCICDNGSTDGTAEALRRLAPDLDVPHHFIFNDQNLGSSVARNQIIDFVLACGADYLLMLDGDIEVVPGSSLAMLCYMESQGWRLGSIGADAWTQTAERARAAPCLYSLHGCRIETDNLLAWTQYGLFRREIFADGVRFDVDGPFSRPGWGWEDHDLAFQMDSLGYLNQRFFGMPYLHRAAQSSVRNLRQSGVDPTALWEERKRYTIEKWQGVPRINQGPLQMLRRLRCFI